MYSPENPEQKMAYDSFRQVVLCFDSVTEKSKFENYVSSHMNQLDNFIAADLNVYDLSGLNGKEKSVTRERLKIGRALNNILLQWRNL